MASLSARPAGLLRRRALALIAALPLAACGLQPLRAPGTSAATRGRVAVDPIAGAAGFALHERLTERLGPPVTPSHRLAVDLALVPEGVGFAQDNVTTRFILRGTAGFSLFLAGSAEPILTDAVTAQTAYSAPPLDMASAYAARAAGRDAEERLARELADRIAMRLALTAREWLAAGAP